MQERTYNLADLVEIITDTVPGRLALVAGDRRLTFGELDERASRIAHHLAEEGVRPGEHVAVLSYNRAEWIETLLGAFKIRAVPIPVNYRYRPGELRHVLADSGAVMLVGEQDLLEQVGEIRGQLPQLYGLLAFGDEYERAVADSSADRDFGPRSSDDRYIVYTGGTTGMPKGVVWRCEDIFFAALGGGRPGVAPVESPADIAENANGPTFAALICPPLMHAAGQWLTLQFLTLGATIVLSTARRFDAREILRIAEVERVDLVMLTGDVMAIPFANALAISDYDLRNLKVIVSGAAPLSAQARARILSVLPGLEIADHYGASELGRGESSFPDQSGPPRFHASAALTVLDEGLRPAPPGVIGRLARTGHIPLGYHNDPETTRQAFPVDPDGTRWVVSGDYATREENGSITLLGRDSLVINSGGEKVYPEEVESILRSHPAVADAIVVGVPDELFGERVGAVVAFKRGQAATLDALDAHCRDHIAGYKVPRALFVASEVRRSAAGKADYGWARSFAAAAGRNAS